MLDAPYERDSVEKKPVIVVSFGKALCELPPYLCDRLVAGPSSEAVAVTESMNSYARMNEMRFDHTNQLKMRFITKK